MPGHRAKGLIQKLLEEKGITTANKNNVRGESRISGHADEEMEMFTVLVEAERADEIFEFIYFEIEIYNSHHGFMFQYDASRASDFVLPSL